MTTSVPENSLTQSLLVPLMISSPKVKDHSASGLAAQIRLEYQKLGVEDSQVEGGGFEGQYINLGVWEKLLQSSDHIHCFWSS